MRTLLLACVSLISLAGGANAAVSQSSTLPGGPYTSPLTAFFTPTVLFNQHGSMGGVERSPFEGTGISDADGAYTSIEGNGSATFNLSGNQLSLIWGSPDSYNNLSFYSGLNGLGTFLGTINGSSIAPANGTSFSFVTVSGLGNFGSFTLSNSPNINAFEVSTFNVSSVPLPAAFPLFGAALLGLGMLGFGAKRKAASSAAALAAA